MIGQFGDIVFQTSDNKILTFKDFQRQSSAKIEKHQMIGQKAKSEFLGTELETISFIVDLNAGLGVSPYIEIEKFRYKLNNGVAEPLIIGGNRLGQDLWIISNLSDSWNTVFNDGFLYSASLNITLEEYISDVTN